MKFLTAVKQLRKAKGLTQGELASLAGIDQAKVSKIEAGLANVEASTLVSIASALDVEVLLVPRRVIGPVRDLIEQQLTNARLAEPHEPVASIIDDIFIPDEIEEDTMQTGPRR